MKESVKVKRICIGCNKEFFAYPSLIKKTPKSGTHCSSLCRRKRVLKKCEFCGTDFEVRLSENRLKHCTAKCYHQSKKVTKEHHLLRIRAKTRKRRALKLNNLGEFSTEYFKWLCEKLDYKCVMCDREFPLEKLTIDHIVPITKNGKHDNGNIQPLCSRCNTIKSNRSSFTKPNVRMFFNEYKKNAN